MVQFLLFAWDNHKHMLLLKEEPFDSVSFFCSLSEETKERFEMNAQSPYV